MPDEDGDRDGDHAREDAGEPGGDAKNREHQDQRHERNQRGEDGEPEMAGRIQGLLEHGGLSVLREFCDLCRAGVGKTLTVYTSYSSRSVNGELLGGGVNSIAAKA